MKQQQQLPFNELIKTEAWKKFMHKLEILSAAVTVIGLVMRLFPEIPRGNMLLIVGFVNLSTVYTFMAFRQLDEISGAISKLFYKIYGLGLALASITILFKIQDWSFPILAVALISLLLIAVSLLMTLRLKNEYDEVKFNVFHFLRLIVAGISLMYMILNIDFLV